MMLKVDLIQYNLLYQFHSSPDQVKWNNQCNQVSIPAAIWILHKCLLTTNKRQPLKGNSHENLWTDPLNNMDSLSTSKNTANGSWSSCTLGFSSSNGLLSFSSYHEWNLWYELWDKSPAENDKENGCQIKFVSIHLLGSHVVNGEGLWLQASSKTSAIGSWKAS